MSGVSAYIKAANRGEFKWGCVETTDSYGLGGVLVEEVLLKGRSATITREGDNEFVVDVILINPIKFYGDKEEDIEIIEYRASRKSAREFAERLIKEDIRKDIKVTDYQLELMQHCIGIRSGRKNKKPYRNYFCTQETDKDWNTLVELGLAKKGDKQINNNEFVYFWLTQQGVEYTLGKSVSEKYYKKL